MNSGNVRNAVHAESTSLGMDGQKPFLKSITKCLVVGDEVSVEIKCVNEASIESVLDVMRNEFGADFPEHAYSQNLKTSKTPPEIAPVLFTPHADNPSESRATDTPEKRKAQQFLQDPNYSDFRDLRERSTKCIIDRLEIFIWQ